MKRMKRNGTASSVCTMCEGRGTVTCATLDPVPSIVTKRCVLCAGRVAQVESEAPSARAGRADVKKSSKVRKRR